MKAGSIKAEALDRESAADAILDTSRRLYLLRHNTTLSGNISVRLSSNTMLITPASLDKNRITAKHLSLVDIHSKEQESIDGPKPSSEFRLHSEIYLRMPEVRAIVHPHGTFSLALADALGSSLFEKALKSKHEEYVYYIGRFAWQRWIKAGTPEIARAAASAVQKGATVVMLADHGTVAVGKSIAEALGRAESLEKMSERMYIAEQIRMARNMDKLAKSGSSKSK
ncbi:MAG: class II aldolase/adducin family protein [Candidatus Micrarchaeota archaeon]|nr:class II aldolase/adducin family protein [Candidatus Micrarchaeota archaeon]